MASLLLAPPGASAGPATLSPRARPAPRLPATARQKASVPTGPVRRIPPTPLPGKVAPRKPAPKAQPKPQPEMRRLKALKEPLKRPFAPRRTTVRAAKGKASVSMFNPATLLRGLPGYNSAPASLQLSAAPHIEATFVPDSMQLIFAMAAGPDSYPLTEPPEGSEDVPREPGWLAGTDYVLGSTYRGSVVFWEGDAPMRGEFFEPSAGRSRDEASNLEARRMAFSAFLPYDNEAYTLEVPGQDFDGPAPAVRVIGISDNGLNLNEDRPTISKVLEPAFYRTFTVSTPPEQEGGEPTEAVFPLGAPDGMPTVCPTNPRFVVFASLRGYNANNEQSHYTRLYIWDTEADEASPTRVRLLYQVRGASLLHPRFSPDGKFLAFTVAEGLNFPPEDYVTGTGETVENTAPDFVRAFDLLPAADPGSALTRTFTSWVGVVPFQFGVTAGWTNTGTIAAGGFDQVIVKATNFSVDDRTARDMMPFWSELNQLGFSSDRMDADGDGYAEGVPESAAAAKWDIYTFQHPYIAPQRPLGDPNPAVYEHGSPSDLAPVRQSAGATDEGDPNDLHGDWAPLYPDAFLGDAEFVGNTDPMEFLGRDTLAITAPRLVFQTDAGGDWSYFYVNQAIPTEFNGTILAGLPDVTPKEGAPGEPVAISANVNPQLVERDPETGAAQTRVFAVIKDPDNRLFNVTNGTPLSNRLTEMSPGTVTTFYREINSDLPLYDTDSFEAFDAYLEANPETAAGLQVGGLIELTETEAGSGRFAATWFPPMEASDYIIDIVVVTTDPDQFPLVSDNIQGFTTARFVPFANFLVVSDFAQGQQTVPYTTRTPSTAGVPTESYFTQRPHADWSWPAGTPWGAKPTVALEGWQPLGPRYEFQFADMLVDERTGRNVPDLSTAILTTQPLVEGSIAGPFDLWRTQCRNPISLDILSQYQPYTETQVGYPDTTIPRRQRIVDRSVLWFAPHAGRVNGSAGPPAEQYGTVGNPATQAVILAFLNNNGRMLLAGDDVAFTLAQNVANNPNAVLERFRVIFRSDKAPDVDSFGYQYLRTLATTPLEGNQGGLNPIPYVTYTPIDVHFNPPTPTEHGLAPFYSFPQGTYLGKLRLAITPANAGNTREDGASTNLNIDAVSAIPAQGENYGGLAIYQYNDGNTAAVQTQVPLAPATRDYPYVENTSAGKTLFFAFGLEGSSREYRPQGGDNDIAADHYHLEYPLARMMHNVNDFFHTGSIAGRVFVNNSTTPLDNVIVRVSEAYRPDVLGQLRGTDVSGPNGDNPNRATGLYQVNGLDSSIYRLEAYRTGYVFASLASAEVEGATVTRNVNIFLTQVPPGTLTGRVRRVGTDDGVEGATVRIRDITNSIILETTTDANGEYSFQIVQSGLYFVEVTAEGYEPFVTATPINVAQGPAQTTYNVALTAVIPPPLPVTITGVVRDQNNDPVSGATVSLLTPGLDLVTVPQGQENPQITGPDGRYTFVVPAGSYVVRAELDNFQPQTRNVNPAPGTTVTADFRFVPVPAPGVVRGTVTDADDNLITGAAVTITDLEGNIVPTVGGGDNPFSTGIDGQFIFNVNPGTYRVRASAEGFVEQTKEVTVAAGETATVNFQLNRVVVPGILQGRVFVQTSGDRIIGATVRLANADGTVDRTAVTDEDGNYEFTDVPPGTYTVTATAEGFELSSANVTVTEGPAITTQNFPMAFVIVPPAPGTLVVSVFNASNGTSSPVSGATVTVLDPATGQAAGTLDGGANPLATNATGTAIFQVVPGTYTVRVELPGFRTKTRTVTVTEDAEGVPPTAVSFTFGAVVRTFPGGRVLMASVPYDYTGTDMAAVLGLSPGALTTNVVAFNATTQAFVFYPTPPADTFHLGVGYGLRLPTDATIRDTGDVATVGANGAFDIPLQTGWNLIGDPFTATVPWDDSPTAPRILVTTTAGTTSITVGEAVTRGYIQSPLWGGYNVINGAYNGAYQPTTAFTPWEGRWLKVAQPVTLRMFRPAGAATSNSLVSVAVASTMRPFQANADVWSVAFTAESGSLKDGGLALGMSKRGTNGVDAGLDLAKPTPMSGAAPVLYTSFTQNGGAFATDVRGVSTNANWTFTVATNLRGQNVTLAWKHNGALPANTTAYLVDAVGKTRVDMSAVTSYTFRTGRTDETRNFRVEIGPRTQAPRAPGAR